MEQSKIEFYKANPDKFIEDLIPFKLLEYQRKILIEMIKRKDTPYFVSFARLNGRSLIRKLLSDFAKETN